VHRCGWSFIKNAGVLDSCQPGTNSIKRKPKQKEKRDKAFSNKRD